MEKNGIIGIIKGRAYDENSGADTGRWEVIVPNEDNMAIKPTNFRILPPAPGVVGSVVDIIGPPPQGSNYAKISFRVRYFPLQNFSTTCLLQ